ncbi:hypothetical protein [Kitasatospora sp. NPDC018619]|uniref:hypothetical protein n=1 Tax=unclassified Kitasatospora TaxID=2633591 RepID=UPI0037A5E572
MPVSARWLSGTGLLAFLLPVVPIRQVHGAADVFLYGLGLSCAVACAVPPFFARRDRFRVACAAAGMAVAAVSVPTALFGIMAALVVDGWLLFLAFLALPVTALAGLVAGFQRAKGREFGRPAAVIAWTSGGIALVGWAALTAIAVTLPAG